MLFWMPSGEISISFYLFPLQKKKKSSELHGTQGKSDYDLSSNIITTTFLLTCVKNRYFYLTSLSTSNISLWILT